MTTGRRVLSARSLVADAELPVHEASRLLQTATGRDRASLAREDSVPADQAQRFDSLVARRRGGEPLQYIEGASQFGPVEIAVDPRALIPRPETEELWELVVARLRTRPPEVIVDLGTGSGNLALALQYEFPEAEVHGVELSAAAFDLARENVARVGLPVCLHHGDLFDPLPPRLRGNVDLLISNPPYVAEADRDNLPGEVRNHEPEVALFGGADGLDVLRRIVDEAPEWLASDGLLACEIGADQGPQSISLVTWSSAEVMADLAGRDRFLLATKGSA